MPCQHVKKIKDMYRNPENYITPRGRGLRQGWQSNPDMPGDSGFTSGNERDYEHLITIHRLCNTQEYGTSVYTVIKQCNCEDETTIKNLRERLTSLQKDKEQLNQSYQNLQTEVKESQEGVTILRQETLKNILTQQTKLGLSEKELNSAYGEKDYRKILSEVNWEMLRDKRAERTVKNIINILATKKVQNYLARLKERNQKVTWGEITNFLNQLKIISQGWEEIKNSKVLSGENNPLYLPIIQESEALQSSVLSAIDYCKQQQEQIKNSRSQATNSLFELLFEEPPTNPLQLANPTFRGFMDTINKLDSVAEIENFQKEMTEAISEEKQHSQPQFQAQIIHIERGNK